MFSWDRMQSSCVIEYRASNFSTYIRISCVCSRPILWLYRDSQLWHDDLQYYTSVGDIEGIFLYMYSVFWRKKDCRSRGTGKKPHIYK